MTDPMLTAHDVAGLTGLSYHAVLRAIHAGELRAVKIRGRIIVRQEWFDDWLNANVIEPAGRDHPAVTDHPSRARRRTPARGSLAALKAIEGGNAR